MTLRLGVAGHPVGHTISPAIHQAALDALGIDARYERWDVLPAELPAWVATLRAPAVLGASVTVPHKEAIIPLLDDLELFAQRVGAVNTVIHAHGRLIGANTDVAGFTRALADADFAPRGAAVVLLGAGGAARAVAHALLAQGVRRLAIFNRDAARASALAASLATTSSVPDGTVEAHALDAVPILAAHLAECALLVNATSVGLRPGERLLAPELIPTHALVVDLIYNPPQTLLLADAAERGARTLSGLPMLVYQAADQFERWTGRPAPLATMFAAARRALA